ncbi:putative 60S ribosomal protein L5 [Paratrimastix pyriformis]|uniref:60S ribosomal protein L5 n=1 Tax=Paratrimastix pyriformis TaxID=342808 RepID=A0ABQ8UHN3_9EUKA|nr:putative 60S ribosomal protein L5 [Paratrimastix pyriformis]
MAVPHAFSTLVPVNDVAPPKRSMHSAVVYQKKIFVFGGEADGRLLADLWEYDFDRNIWDCVAIAGPQPACRSSHTAVVYRSHMYLFGGYGAKGALNDLYAYNFETRTWRQIVAQQPASEVPTPRRRHSAIVFEDQMYIFGGDDTSAGTSRLNDTYTFNFAMVFHKVVKSKAYFKRYQVQFRRRREGMTDYRARRRLVQQDKNKYNTPKYRLVVRMTNRDVICQIVYSRIVGDFVLCSAYSHELPRFGLPCGLTNYAACYATGLLLARRVLKNLHLDDKYPGVANVTGEISEVEAVEDGPRPFKAFLDIGLFRTTTGARIFAAMKGAADGGLNVPHNEKRLVGYKPKKGDQEAKFNPAILREHIFGVHVAKYMKKRAADKAESDKIHFAKYAAAKIDADKLEKLIKSVHEKIRANPDAKDTRPRKEKEAERKAKFGAMKAKFPRKAALTLLERKNRFRQKLAAILAKAAAQSE